MVDAKEIHYEALNKALAIIDEKYVINREEHLSTYDGNTSTYMRFAKAFSSSNIIDTHNNISSCISNCTTNSLCNGYFVYNNSCNELYNTDDYVYTDLNCSSYTKIVHYEGDYNHSISGISVSTVNTHKSTVYLDLNQTNHIMIILYILRI